MGKLFDNPADMEPLLPEDREGVLADLALDLIRQSDRLSSALHPFTRKGVVDLVRSMNSFYSNLIEGHRTTPRDIEAALKKDFSPNPKQRALQVQHLAHVEVQQQCEQFLSANTTANICSAEFLCFVHKEFYERLPDSFRVSEGADGKSHPILPGRLREVEVSVGRHLAPTEKKLAEFLKRFADFYGPLVKGDHHGLIAAAAAHHRLAWIHPFLDGNGRVARLFTHAWFRKAEVDSDGLWTISRGLARRQNDYRAALSNADEKRVNDFDGRGYLSQRYLFEFCQFFLQTGIDQVTFMRELLDMDNMQRRILAYAERKEAIKELPSGSGLVLRDIFLRGEIPRGDVFRIIGASPRTAQKVTGELLAQGLATSNSPKGPLRLGFPGEAAAYYFPNLYPAGSDTQ